MPTLTDLTNRLVSWLKTAAATPAFREYALTAALPHCAYPALAVLTGRVRFTPNSQCASAHVTLRVACCAGRLPDAQAEALALAAELKRHIEASHGLGGLARQLAVNEVCLKDSGRPRSQASGPPSLCVQFAEVELRLLFNV